MTIQQARIAVGNQIGLPMSFDGTMAGVNALPVTQKQALTAALLTYILEHPADFTTEQVATANAEKGYISTLTLETGYTETELLTELENGFMRTVGTPLAKIGDGVSNSLQLTGTILPVVVLAVVGIVLFSFFKKQTA